MTRLTVDELRTLCLAAFRAHDFSEEEAHACTEEVVEAECRGRRAHGTAMIPRLLEWKESAGEPAIVHETPIAARIEGNGALGPLLARRAMDLAIAKARATTIGIAGVRNVSAFLTAGHQPRRAAQQGLIGIDLSVAACKVAAWGSAVPSIGTNPLGIGIPSEDGPIVIDLAVSALTVAEVRAAQRRGERLPADSAIAPEGTPTSDPALALAGAVLPFGGHKGSALGIAIELLAGPLVGAHAGRTVGSGRGMLFLALDPDVLGVGAGFAAAASAFAAEVRGSSPRPGFAEVLLPGDRGERMWRSSAEDGVELEDATCEHLRELARGPR